MTIGNKMLYMLIQHIRFACSTNANQNIISIFFKTNITTLQLYSTNKVLLIKNNLFYNILVHNYYVLMWIIFLIICKDNAKIVITHYRRHKNSDLCLV